MYTFTSGFTFEYAFTNTATHTDNHASAYYTNPHLYCVAMVFACYYE